MSLGLRKINGHEVVSEKDMSTIEKKVLHECINCGLSSYQVKTLVQTDCN